MLRSCLFCHAPLPGNDVLEQLPVGRRLAFDPARGRLWAVCPVCGRWNLAPIEERWEAMEELEKLIRDRARLLLQTDNIGLLRVGELDLVRIGRAELREEAWWRYGRAIASRRAVSWAINGAQLVLMAATGSIILIGAAGSVAQWLRFGRTAWRGEVACPTCGKVTHRLGFAEASRLFLVPGPDGAPVLQRECGACALRAREGWVRWTGADADRAIRRIMAFQNAAGASQKRVSEAASTILAAGSAQALLLHAAERRPQLREFKKWQYRTASLALEIAANEDVERRLLELEAKALELRWKEEEALAAISDGELTPLAHLDRLVRRIRQ